MLPQFSEAGTWKATAILKDATRNMVSYAPAQLASSGLSSQLIVIKPSLEPDGTISQAGGTVTDSVNARWSMATISSAISGLRLTPIPAKASASNSTMSNSCNLPSR